MQVKATVYRYTITEGIRPYTSYNVSVRARTEYPEWGPRKTETVTTAESGEPFYDFTLNVSTHQLCEIHSSLVTKSSYIKLSNNQKYIKPSNYQKYIKPSNNVGILCFAYTTYICIYGEKRFEILADFYLGCKSNHTKALVNAFTICMYAHAIAIHVHVCLSDTCNAISGNGNI